MKKTAKRAMLLTLLSPLALTGLIGCKRNDGKIHVTFWHTMGKNLQGVLGRILEGFYKENPDIVVDHAQQGNYDDLEDKLSAAIPAGTTPTIAFCYPDHVAEYMQSNAVLNLDNYINDPELGFTDEDGLVSDFIDIYWQEGQEYATEGTFSLPWAKSTEMMFYNKDVFEDAAKHRSGKAYAVPTTWEDLEDLMAEMKVDYPDVIPLGYDSDANLFITLCEQYGIPYTHIDQATGMGKADFNNAAAKAMVNKLLEWYGKGYITTQGLSNGAYTSTQFTEGTLLMTVGSTGGTTYNYTSNFTVGAANMLKPSTENPFNFGGTLGNTDRIIMQGPSICFFRKGTQEQKEAAWKFYKYATRTINSCAYSTASGYSPVRKSSYTCDEMVSYLASKQADSDALVQNTIANYAEITTRYYVSPAFHGSSTARKQVDGIFSNVAMGTKTLDQAFADAIAKTNFAING